MKPVCFLVVSIACLHLETSTTVPNLAYAVDALTSSTTAGGIEHFMSQEYEGGASVSCDISSTSSAFVTIPDSSTGIMTIDLNPASAYTETVVVQCTSGSWSGATNSFTISV